MPVLAYWKIRGLAQPIRLLLEYTGTEFEDRHYECGPAPDFDKSCWFDVKHDLGLPFPNLPYYLDGDAKIVQSNAILRHIARKNDLCGRSDVEKDRVDILENEAMDFRNGLVRLCYHPNFDNLKGKYLEDLRGKIQAFSSFLGSRRWFAGDNITFPDFVIYELLDQHLQLDPSCLDQAQNLKEFLTRFENLEPIKKYMKSNRFLKAPLNNKVAKFGSEP